MKLLVLQVLLVVCHLKATIAVPLVRNKMGKSLAVFCIFTLPILYAGE